MAAGTAAEIPPPSAVRLVAQQAVVGVATGYSPAQVEPFVASLRVTGFAGTVVLMSDAPSLPALVPLARRYDLDMVRVPHWPGNVHPVLRTRLGFRLLWPALSVAEWTVVRSAGRRGRSVARRLLHPLYARFLFYQELLSSSRFERLLLADVRDVVFQTDPFTTMATPGLAMGLESDAYTIASDFWNELWIRTVFGREMLARIGHQRVCCAGVVLGDGPAMATYVDLMVEQIMHARARAMTWVGTDQGMHNMLLWTGRLGSPHLHDTLRSPLATLNGIAMEDLRLDADGRLLNADGSIVSVLHQFDRVPGLPELLAAAGP